MVPGDKSSVSQTGQNNNLIVGKIFSECDFKTVDMKIKHVTINITNQPIYFIYNYF